MAHLGGESKLKRPHPMQTMDPIKQEHLPQDLPSSGEFLASIEQFWIENGSRTFLQRL
jgi:hypothetical protein